MLVQKETSNLRHRVTAWVVWFLAAIPVPYQFILQASTSVMIPLLMRDFKIDEEAIGFLTSIFFYPYLIFQVPGGMLVDRYGARQVLLWGMILFAVGCLWFAHATFFGLAGVGRAVMGLASAPFVAAALYIAANWFSTVRFAFVVGLTEMLAMIGAAAGEPSLAAVVTRVGWRDTMVICAALGVVLALVVVIFVRNTPSKRQSELLKLDNPPALMTEGVVRGFIKSIKQPQLWLIGLFGGLTFAMLPAFAGLWVIPTLQRVFHITLETAALAGSVTFIGAVIGTPFWGWLSGLFYRRRLIMMIATVLNIIVTAIFIYVPHLSLWFVFVVLGVMGFLTGVYVLIFAMTREITDRSIRGSAMGFTNMMCIAIGAPILQPLIGYLLRSDAPSNIDMMKLPIASYRYALTSLVVCLVLALVILLLIRETRYEKS